MGEKNIHNTDSIKLHSLLKKLKWAVNKFKTKVKFYLVDNIFHSVTEYL